MAAPARLCGAGGRGRPCSSGAAAAAALVWAVQARPAEAFDLSWEPVPRGYHNLFVLSVSLCALIWVAKIAQKFYLVVTIQRRLAISPALPLERMSLYAEDFQRLIRQHFNQILRMRRTVPPRAVDRRTLGAHLQPESLEVVSDGSLLGLRFTVDTQTPCTVRLYWGVSIAACNGLLQHAEGEAGASAASRGAGGGARRPPEARWSAALVPLLPQGPGPAAGAPPAASAAGAGGGNAGVQGPMSGSVVEITERSAGARSSAAAAAPAAGNSAVGEAARDLFTPADCALRSAPALLPAGTAQRFELPREDFIDRNHLAFDLGATWPPREGESGRSSVPLAVALTAHQPAANGKTAGNVEGMPVVQARTQVTLLRFRGEASAPPAPEVLHQLALGDDGLAHRMLGIFGFEADGGEEYDCMICYDRPRSVLLLPCRHCSVCPTCLRSLRDERCPLCRSIFSAYLLFPTQTV